MFVFGCEPATVELNLILKDFGAIFSFLIVIFPLIFLKKTCGGINRVEPR